MGWHVVLYQSARQEERSSQAVGYFATALVTTVLLPAGKYGHAELLVTDLTPLDNPQPMIVKGSFREESLRTPSRHFDGWRAAEDVREISLEQYLDLTGSDAQKPFTGVPDLAPIVPRLQNYLRPIRDKRLRAMVYRAYGGRCAISGVSLLHTDGSYGLVQRTFSLTLLSRMTPSQMRFCSDRTGTGALIRAQSSSMMTIAGRRWSKTTKPWLSKIVGCVSQNMRAIGRIGSCSRESAPSSLDKPGSLSRPADNHLVAWSASPIPAGEYRGGRLCRSRRQCAPGVYAEHCLERANRTV